MTPTRVLALVAVALYLTYVLSVGPSHIVDRTPEPLPIGTTSR